jgi:FkbM family methyltransferase
MPEEIWDKENVYWECLDNIAPHLFATEDWESCRQEQFNKALQDGTYIFDKVLVNPGDVVIDAGANLGFFSAYAAYKGGIVHAFEPDRGNRRCLEQTARLNANIAVHHQALMARTSKVAFLEAGNSGSTAVFLDKIAAPIAEIDAITVDDFIQSSSLAKVDFIKADIEGAERMLLTGATRTLQEFAPKLAICTYHSPEDPQLLAKIILTANPRYKVIQGRKKLYAFV